MHLYGSTFPYHYNLMKQHEKKQKPLYDLSQNMMRKKKKRHLELINWSSSLHANLIPLIVLLLAYGDSTLYGLTVTPNHPLHHLGTRKSMQFPVASHGEDIDLPEPEGPARKPRREDIHPI